jgi:hypothetical protein
MKRIALFAALAVAISASAAFGHDIYSKFYEGGAPGLGRWCCSGDEEGKTGDCAPATYEIRPNGDAVMESRRYPGKKILVAKHRILWMSIPGGEKYEAHYCGIPRYASSTPPNDDDPDLEFITYCAAIVPGGV